jgi:Flp pilus assembly protein TadB
MGVGLVSLILGASLSLVTIAVAWLVYRPFLGVVLLALAGALVFWLTKTRRNRALAKRGSMMPVA